ncbi:MAG: hypothetical protein LBK83_13675 [Treponema sp.]|jgi:uncharacterized membrane protein|nr:hypothetical protein [Treponema sp.]
MSNPRPLARKQNNSEILLEEENASFSGPLPPPAVLKGYGEVDPQYPERLFKMAESYSEADVRAQNTISSAIIVGLIFSFIVCIGGLATCLVLAMKGMKAESITAAITGISPIVINALSNFRNPSK